MRRAVFGPPARFRLLDEAGQSADFEIERGGGNGTVVVRSLGGDGSRTFDQRELRRTLAEHRLQFHLEGRHVAPSADEGAALAPREPDFGAVPAADRDLAERRYAAIGPLLGKPGRTAAEVRDRGLAIGISERTLWNWLRWYEQAAVWLAPCSSA